MDGVSHASLHGGRGKLVDGAYSQTSETHSEVFWQVPLVEDQAVCEEVEEGSKEKGLMEKRFGQLGQWQLPAYQHFWIYVLTGRWSVIFNQLICY